MAGIAPLGLAVLCVLASLSLPAYAQGRIRPDCGVNPSNVDCQAKTPLDRYLSPPGTPGTLPSSATGPRPYGNTPYDAYGVPYGAGPSPYARDR